MGGPEETTVVGTDGWLRLEAPAHCPTRLTVTTTASRTEHVVQQYDFPNPPLKDGVGQLHYPGGEGFRYQAVAVQQAIADGLIEHPLYPHAESQAVCSILDQVRSEIGLKYPDE